MPHYIPVLRKMSNIEVIQRVLDYLVPVEIYGRDQVEIDRHDSHAFKIADYLLNGDQLGLNEYLDVIQSNKGKIELSSGTIARSRYLSWCLMNVWRTQQRPDSNRRITYDETYYTDNGAYRVVDEMAAIQKCLENYDPLRRFPAWLHGEDTLCAYDLFAEKIWLDTRGIVKEEVILETLLELPTYKDEYEKHPALPIASNIAFTIKNMRTNGTIKRMEIYRRKMWAEKLSREEKILWSISTSGNLNIIKTDSMLDLNFPEKKYPI